MVSSGLSCRRNSSATRQKKRELLARLPSDLGPGTYVFRVDAADAAGNTATSTRRSDGTEMTVRKVAGEPVAAVKRAEPAAG